MSATPPRRCARPSPSQRPNLDSGFSTPASLSAQGPPTPAPTTSDVHNSNNQHLAGRSPSPSPSPSPAPTATPPSRSRRLSRSPVMTRFMTIDPEDSSLRFEAMAAIREGRVAVGEDMLEKRRREMEAEDLDERIMYEKEQADGGVDGERGQRE